MIPAYNAEKFLVKCVESVVNQTYKNLEIILVDDGSKDSTPQICDELASKFNNIKVIHQANQGIREAWHTGIDNATGDYITFIDSDDYIKLNAYEEAVKILEDNNCDMLQFGFYSVDLNGKIFQEFCQPDFKTESRRESFKYFSERAAWYSVWSKVYKRSLFENIGWPPNKTAADYCLSAQTFSRAERFININKIFYYYVKNPESITQVEFKNKSRKDDLIMSYDFVINFTAKNFPEFLPEALLRKIVIMQHVFTSYLKLNCDKLERKEILNQTSKLMREDYNRLKAELKKQGRKPENYNLKTSFHAWMSANVPGLYEIYLKSRLKLHALTGI
ncbi:MAG: glycosyltransferase family 2 protein [Synergistaceae bacterium]|nr:glycosyltransferase family 2 protein [Synergistaceae bacterium]